MTPLRSVVRGCGASLPRANVTNDDLRARGIETSDEWIVQRTGIRSRSLAAEDELTSTLAIAASRQALERAGLEGSDIDLIVLATTTPDRTFPATAVRVQAALGARGAAFDVQAVCAGFLYALGVADSMLKAGQGTRALVIGAETFSRLLDWDDRTTCVLFGDGAGAVILEAQEATGTSADRGILSTHLQADGRHEDILYVDGGPSSTGTTGHVRMAGKEVFRHAVEKLAATAAHSIAAAGLTPADIDWLVPHQANKRIIDATAQKLGLPAEKVVLTVDRHGNTSAASIPLALSAAWEEGKLQPGQLVLVEAIGGGLAWGSALLRW